LLDGQPICERNSAAFAHSPANHRNQAQTFPPTFDNLISITTAIYLSPSLFELGVLPAVDVENPFRALAARLNGNLSRGASDLKLRYAQFEELETFARIGARMYEDTRTLIEPGREPRLPQATGICPCVRTRTGHILLP
jgi:F0F1-type ATP synthase alpha subunit